jgi:hypothetical protein
MQTLPVAAPEVKAFYALLYERHGILGKVDGRIYFFDDNGEVVDYEPEMAPWVCILGEVVLADTQRLMDVIVHGGYATVACSRLQEVR